jgi:hypothetical protein
VQIQFACNGNGDRFVGVIWGHAIMLGALWHQATKNPPLRAGFCTHTSPTMSGLDP